MTYQCAVTGKKPSRGVSYARRGKAKYLGGVGRKVTGKTKRRFLPNLQRVKIEIDGKVQTVRVSVKAIRGGLAKRPVKRKPFQMPNLQPPYPKPADERSESAGSGSSHV